MVKGLSHRVPFSRRLSDAFSKSARNLKFRSFHVSWLHLQLKPLSFQTDPPGLMIRLRWLPQQRSSLQSATPGRLCQIKLQRQ